jgi:hypothetical protein
VKVVSALVFAALVLYPMVGSAEMKPSIQVPPGWTSMNRGHTGGRGWQHGNELLIVDTAKNTKRRSLRSYVDVIVLPASNASGAHVVSNRAATTCGGHQPAWLVVYTIPAQPGAPTLFETFVAVDGGHAYQATYGRPSTDPPRPDAERAIRSLCIK